MKGISSPVNLSRCVNRAVPSAVRSTSSSCSPEDAADDEAYQRISRPSSIATTVGLNVMDFLRGRIVTTSRGPTRRSPVRLGISGFQSAYSSVAVSTFQTSSGLAGISMLFSMVLGVVVVLLPSSFLMNGLDG